MHQYPGNSAIQGTLYLKQAYQKNMLIALLIGISLHLAALGAYSVVTYSFAPQVVKRHVPPPDSIIVRILPQPPPIDNGIPMEVIKVEPGVLPEYFIPEPVDDWLAPERVVLPTNLDKHFAAQIGNGELTTSVHGAYIPPLVDKKLPGIGDFTYAEEYPEAIHLAPLRYPEMARRAGMHGSVIVRALIDMNGDVIDASVVEASTEGVGFEEAALEAAFKGKWTPALLNNSPIPCWVSYKVIFELK